MYEDVPAGPPNYPKNENAPASPPGYGTVGEYTGPPIPDYEELDRLHERASNEHDRGEGSSTGRSLSMDTRRPNPREFIDLLQDETDIRTRVEEEVPASPDIE